MHRDVIGPGVTKLWLRAASSAAPVPGTGVRRHRLQWHEVRTMTNMSAGKLLLFVFLCTIPSAVSAQPWRDA
jgi:hypothetical protein